MQLTHFDPKVSKIDRCANKGKKIIGAVICVAICGAIEIQPVET